MIRSAAIEIGTNWFAEKGWEPFPFQKRAWKSYLQGKSGMINAPTGSGKTYSLIIPILLEFIQKHENDPRKEKNGLQAIWITPIRALTTEISMATQRALDGLGLNWKVGVRTGDTPTSERQKMKKNPPEILITTPESLHLLMASKDYPKFFRSLKAFVADEWHELIGSKRGVQVELALSRLKTICPKLKIWGISATIGNMEEALEVLLGDWYEPGKFEIIRAKIKKEIEVESILPDEIERFPWAGHLGIKLVEKLVPIIRNSGSTLIFTNTRAMSEIWYQKILEVAPDLAGILAMHHGSISRELRTWVEDALHEGTLKAVVCTSSLDLGVDFRPVETIVQVGSPKGVSRFMQRAGRSGHQPGAKSKIYFLPTHSLELVEAAALREAVLTEKIEARTPYVRSFDVLVQYLVTLAVSDGFRPKDILKEVKGTFCYRTLSDEEWAWMLDFITTGGSSLSAYEDFNKVEIEDGLFKVNSRRLAMRHRMSIGTIVSDSVFEVKYLQGSRIGTIEEWFITQLKPGDVFGFAGRFLELVRIKGTTALVRKSKKKSGKIPSWQGGRMPLSSMMSQILREKLGEATRPGRKEIELRTIAPIVALQAERSIVPKKDQLLIEYFESREGFHLVIYPFEGRFVHQVLGALIAYRISLIHPISFSIAMTDYGFELLSDKEIPIQEALDSNIFTSEYLTEDIQASINAAEMASRKFRDIAHIAGLVFQGFPGKPIREKHLQASTYVLFKVFSEYDADNLLLKQAYEEVFDFQLEEARLREALDRISESEIVLVEPEKATPFAFPILVDRLRERVSSEKLADRIKRMTLQLEK